MVTVDFSGSDPQVEGSINAVEAITYSACFYVFRCLLAEDVPATAGLMRPIRVIAPEGTVVNARPPAAVAGGNVETSQRIVDVLLRAMAQAMPERIPAAAAGTMNNLTIGGIDPRTGEPFAYYETIAGGMGARPTKPGVSGVHTHMTNSLNTPAEALEYAYPLRVRRYSLRHGSGGSGKYHGGDGIVREIEVLSDAEVTLLADRRTRGPYGLPAVEDGAPGTADSDSGLTGRSQSCPGSSMYGCARVSAFGSSRRVGVDGESEAFTIFDFRFLIVNLGTERNPQGFCWRDAQDEHAAELSSSSGARINTLLHGF